jgi:diguanylate cyclase (GGDEF)-like protein
VDGGGAALGAVLDVLLVEDDDDHARLVEEILAGGTDGPYLLRRVSDLAGARAELDKGPVDCILLDLFLPDGQGLDSLTQLTTLEPMVPIVILTSLADEQLGLEAVHVGAQDYLVKGNVDGPRLTRSLRHAIERKALEARFAEQALHDALTGLANRTLLLDRIRLELARAGRLGSGVALFYLDMDDFKAINDRLGHDAGDEVLVRVARRLVSAVRPGDTVGRIGGDEFVVVCGGLDSAAAADMRTRIEETVARPLLLGAGTELVTASVGVATGKGADEPEALLRRADEAMYEAKRSRPPA